MFSPVTFRKTDFKSVAKTVGFSFQYKIKPLKGGLINALFEINEKNQSYVIRVYIRKKPIKDIQYEIKAMKFLRERNIPIPLVISKKEKSLFSVKKYPSIILEKILGNTIHPSRLTKEQVLSIADTVGKMRKVGARFYDKTSRIEYDLFDFQYDDHFSSKYNERISTAKGIKKGKTLALFIEAETIKNKIELSKKKDSKKTFIHNDLRLDNFLFRKKTVVGLLDFDECMFGSPTSDIATLLGQIPNSSRNAFLERYEKEAGEKIDRELAGSLAIHYKLLLLKWTISQFFKSQDSNDWKTFEGYKSQYIAFRIKGDENFPNIDNYFSIPQ